MKRVLLLSAVLMAAISMATAQQVEFKSDSTTHTVAFDVKQPKVRPSAKQFKWNVDLTMGSMVYNKLFLEEWKTAPDIVPGGTTDWHTSGLNFFLSADIYRQLGPKFALGLRTSISYEQLNCYNAQDEVLGSVKTLPSTIVLVGKVSYYKGHEFEFYGLYGLGASLTINIDDFYWRPSPSISHAESIAEIYPIGLRWGRKMGFFGELGIGSKGLINAGYFVNF